MTRVSRRDKCQVGKDFALAIVEMSLVGLCNLDDSFLGSRLLCNAYHSGLAYSPYDSFSHAEWKLLLHLVVLYT